MICPNCKNYWSMVYIGGAVGMGIPLYACKTCGAVATEIDKIKKEGKMKVHMIDEKKSFGVTELKYCPRTKHSEDMPLKRPRKNCHCKGSSWIRRYPKAWDRRNPDECEFYPMHLKYMEANNIKLDNNFGIRFRCVLDAHEIWGESATEGY